MIILQTGVMSFFMVLTLALSVLSLINVRNEMISTNLSALYVTQNQLDNIFDRLDSEFLNYLVEETCHNVLRNVQKDTPKESYFIYEADAITWMNRLLQYYEEVDGVFIFYENIGNPIFRDRSSNTGIRGYLMSAVRSGKQNFNHYGITDEDGSSYAFIIKSTGTFYGGIWINADKLRENLALDEYPGEVFLCDSGGNLALAPLNDVERIKTTMPGHSYSSEEGKQFLYATDTQGSDIYLMMTKLQ